MPHLNEGVAKNFYADEQGLKFVQGRFGEFFELFVSLFVSLFVLELNFFSGQFRSAEVPP